MAAPPLLTIQVRDSQNLPVARVQLHLRHHTAGEVGRCETASTGECTIPLTLLGEYRVTADRDGLDGAAQSLFANGEAASVNLTLNPSALRSSVTVVSGSRTEELQEESASKVEAVTREQMLRTGYERVSDVLTEIPGVLIRRGSTSTVGGEQVQGIDSRQVAVLQDGLPVPGARGVKSGALNLNRQTVGRLARVEVAKGAGSPLYGSDAIGGVINMITREPVQPIESNLSISGGTLGTMDARGDIGGRYGRWMYFLNLGTNRMDSYRLIPSSSSTVGPDIRRNDGLFKTRYQFSPKFSLGFTANAYHNREEGQNVAETGLVNGLVKDSVQSYAVVADWILDPSTTLQVRGYASRYDENNLTTPLSGPDGPSTANLNERLKRLDATLSRQFGSHNFLQGGAEWAQNLYRGVNRIVGDNVGQQVTSNDYWIQDKLTAGRVTVLVGGRVTRHSLFGNAAVPKVGLIYKLNDSWILRGSWGMGFRAPDLGQLYYRFANPASFYQVIGNPNLQPEHSASYQAGVLFRRSRYRLGVNLYRNNVRDLIDSRVIGTPQTAEQLNMLLATYNIPPFFNPLLGRQTFIYLNLSRIFTQGFEVDGEYAIHRNLRVSGAYTFLQAKDRVTQLALTQRHRHTGFVRADYVVPKYGIVANVRGTFYSYWLLSATNRGLGFQIWDFYISKSLGKGLQSFLAIDNLNNSRDGKLQLAAPTFDRPDYGRTYRVGLRYRFGERE